MSHFCPAMYLGNEDEDFTQLSPTTFGLDLSVPEMFRFSCSYSSVANLKLSGVVKVTIPTVCMVSGSVLALTPTNEIHFNRGVVSTLLLKPAWDIEMELVEYTTNNSVYHSKSGIPGPSLEEASIKWKEHLLKLDTHFSLWAKVKVALGVLLAMVLLILVLKCYFTCQQSCSQDLAQWETGELHETQAHLTTQFQLLAPQGQAEIIKDRLTYWMRNSSLEKRNPYLAWATVGSRSWFLGMLAEGGSEDPEEACPQESAV